MPLLSKMTATQQLAYDATLAALCHHFQDPNVRWVSWTLYDDGCGDEYDHRSPEPQIVSVLYYQFRGVIEVPVLHQTLCTGLRCVIRDMEDGSREICGVSTTLRSFCDEADEMLPLPQSYMSYHLGVEHPQDRPLDALAKFLPQKFVLQPRKEEVEA